MKHWQSHQDPHHQERHRSGSRRSGSHGTADGGSAEHRKLLLEWAWSQVEAYADDSLGAESQARMRQAMALDTDLALAVQRACEVTQGLHAMVKVPVPAGLWRRLWHIPSAARSQPWDWLMGPGFALSAVAMVLIAITAGVWLRPTTVKPADMPLTVAQQQAAIHDFQTAMHYVKKTAALSGRATTRGMGGGLQRALVTSMNTWVSDDWHFENGE